MLGKITQRTSRRNRNDVSYPVCSINNQIGFILQSEQFEQGSYDYLDKTSYKIVKKDEFAYNPARINVGSIGRLKNMDKAIVSSLYVCFKLSDKNDAAYFENWFNGYDFYKEIIRNLEGSVREYLFYENFSKIRMPVPPIAEQQKIAEILAQCDKVIALKQELLDEKRKQKKWLMNKLLNPCAKDKNNIEWQHCQMKDICTVFSGGTPKSTQAKYYSTSEIPFIRSGEIDEDQTALYISNEGIKNSSAKMIGKGDLLYALYGANSGDCAIAKISGAINQAILCIRSHSVKPLFLYYVLSSMKETIVSTYLQGGQGNLSAEIIKKLRISVPKDLGVRTKIITILSTADKEIDLLEQELTMWKQKKKGLAQLLLTGLVRV